MKMKIVKKKKIKQTSDELNELKLKQKRRIYIAFSVISFFWNIFSVISR
jgi:uncharacterized membrane protein